MTFKVYGKSDEDLTAETLLRELVKGKEVKYLMLHARVPINARPCQLPGSLTLRAVMEDGTIITVRQNRKGAKAFRVGRC